MESLTIGDGLPAKTQAVIFRAVKVIAPLLLSAAVAWGSVQFLRGRDAQRLDTLEDNQKHILTREEFKTWTDEQRARLGEINDRLLTQERKRSEP